MSTDQAGDAPVGPVLDIDASSFEPLLDDVAGHLNAQHGRLIDLTIWLLAHPEAWQGDGVWTASQYLAWRCGVGPALASNVIAAAERADELPVAIETVRRGEMSLDQLMPIVRKVPAWADRQAVSLVKRLTVAQTRRLVAQTDWAWQPMPPDQPSSDTPSGSRDVADSDRAPASEPLAATDDRAASPTDENRISYGFGPGGRWFLHADLDADLGELFSTALDEVRDALVIGSRTEAVDRDACSAVTDADAFVELAQRSLDTVASPARRNRYRVNLYLERSGHLVTDRGVAIPEPIARYLTCDGSIDPVLVEEGRPVSVGRSQRTIPDRTRRTVLHRDGHCCQVPGCTATRGLDLHHIVHWSQFGPTDTWNLITLCARHHRLHHKQRLGISGNADVPDSLVFSDARGRPIRASGARPSPPGEPPPPIIGTYEHPLGERLDPRWVTFVDPDTPHRTTRNHGHRDIA